MDRWMMGIAAMVLLSACTMHDEHGENAGHTHDQNVNRDRPAAGSNLMLRAPITLADGIEVIISDVVIPAGATVPRHYHPGEEFVYVIEGSAIQVEEGKEDQVLAAGDAYVIVPQAVHAPIGGPSGARAIVFRVHVEGQPERIAVPE